MIGKRSIMRSISRAKLRERRKAVVKANIAPTTTPSMAHQ